MDNIRKIIYDYIKENQSRFFTTTPSSEDEFSKEWDVTYEPNIERIYNEVLSLVKQLENAGKFYNDSKFNQIITLSKEIRRRLHGLKSKKDIKETDISYNTPNAFSKNMPKYYYKLGYKNIPKHKPKSFDKKQIWEDESQTPSKRFQDERIQEFDEMNDIINKLSPLISNAKNETIEFYSANPGSFDIYKPSTMVLTYLTKALDLLNQKQ